MDFISDDLGCPWCGRRFSSYVRECMTLGEVAVCRASRLQQSVKRDPCNCLLPRAASARMTALDKAINAVVLGFSQAAKDEEDKVRAFLDKEFADDPNLRFRIATFLKNPALRAILKGSYGAEPDTTAASTPEAPPVKETKLYPSVIKFSTLTRYLILHCVLTLCF